MRIVKKLVRRFRGADRFPWTDPTGIYVDVLEDATRKQLSTARTTDVGWKAACLAHGLACSFRVRRDRRNLDSLASYVHGLLDDNGRPRLAPSLVDHCMVAYTLLELFEQSSDQRYRRGADALFHFLSDGHVQTAGLLPYRAKRPRLMLVDTLGMACPFLVRYGTCFQQPDAVELALRQLEHFLDHGIDTTTALPFHAYEVDGAEHLGLMGWARGVGWLAVGLVDSLAHLNCDHRAAPRLAAALRAMFEALAGFQREDGSWGWAIAIPGASIDTSGTAMIGYALVRAVSLGLLDESWLDVARNALQAVARSTRAGGVVDHANGECLGVGIHPPASGPQPPAQGFALALAVLLLDVKVTSPIFHTACEASL